MKIDYFDKDCSELNDKKLFLLDMDGTIYEEDMVFNGVLEFLSYIEHIGGKYVFITNNSSKSVDDYINKLVSLGIKCDIDNFYTATQATILYLQSQYPDSKIYCQGTRSFVQELKEAGINVTEADCSDIDVVLVGFDTELTSQKLRNTCKILSTLDVAFIATNPDIRCPVNFGFVPDCGSICGIITAATGKKPMYIGKPEPTMITSAREKMGYSVKETVVIGDRLYTDIAAALNAGVTAVCVLTGETSVDDINTDTIKPTFTFLSVKEMLESMMR